MNVGGRGLRMFIRDTGPPPTGAVFQACTNVGDTYYSVSGRVLYPDTIPCPTAIAYFEMLSAHRGDSLDAHLGVEPSWVQAACAKL